MKMTGIVLMLLGGLFIAGQGALRWGVNYYFREKARIPLRIGRLFINPASGQISLGLKGAEPGQMLLLNLGQVRFDWWDLLLRRFRLGNARFADIELSVRRDPYGHLYVGDINVPTGVSHASTQAAHPAGGSHWGVGVGNVDVSNIRVMYQAPDQKIDLKILRFHLDPTESWNPSRGSHFNGDIDINGRQLTLTGIVRPFSSTISLDTHVTFVDPTLNPPFRFTLEPLSVRIDYLLADDPAIPVQFKILMQTGQSSKTLLNGSWSLHSSAPTGRLELRVDGLNLSPFTSFSQHYAGYRISSGLLDVETTADVRAGALESDTSLTAHKFYLDKMKKSEMEESDQRLGLPLGLGLALLRDADDNIRLQIPVQGDLNDPKIPIGKLVWQILGKAFAASLRNAVTSFFPSGNKIGFDPVMFAPGRADLSPESLSYLQKIGEKLVARPQVSIKLTGQASGFDWLGLQHRKIVPETKSIDVASLKPKDSEKLLVLSSARCEALRAYLSETMHVDAKRLLVSPPAIDPSASAQGRVELALP